MAWYVSRQRARAPSKTEKIQFVFYDSGNDSIEKKYIFFYADICPGSSSAND